MKKIYLTIFASIFLGLISCTPKIYSQDKDTIIKEAFTQKEIPGQADGKVRTYLKVNFDLKQGEIIQVDSVTFRGVTTPINTPARRLKVQLSLAQLKNKPTSGAEEAIVYFTKDGKAYKRVLSSVGSKEDLFLP